MCIKKIFSSKKILVKKFLDQKYLGPKKFGVKKYFWNKKNFGQIDLDPNFFCLKKHIGLTQGGGYMTPPQKIVGLKLCWIVVSFA